MSAFTWHLQTGNTNQLLVQGGDLVTLVLCWRGLGLLVHLDGRVTANQSNVVLNNHLHPQGRVSQWFPVKWLIWPSQSPVSKTLNEGISSFFVSFHAECGSLTLRYKTDKIYTHPHQKMGQDKAKVSEHCTWKNQQLTSNRTPVYPNSCICSSSVLLFSNMKMFHFGFSFHFHMTVNQECTQIWYWLKTEN